VLLCGFVAAAIFGLMTILAPPGDSIGWAYIALGVIGYFYIQTHIFTTFVWLLVSAAGVAVAWAGNASGWVETGLGVMLAVVSVLPVAGESGGRASSRNPVTLALGRQPPVVDANGGHESLARGAGPAVIDSGGQAVLGTGSIAAASDTGPISIHAIGQLRIQVGGRDITDRLSEPRLAFLFSYLLACQVQGVDVTTNRNALAEEVAYGISTAGQRDRLRKQLHDLKEADPVFDRVLRANRSQVSLDLDGVDLDVGRLLQARQAIRNRDHLINSELANHFRRLLDESKGMFLTGFEELEHQVTAGRGSARQVVEDARIEVGTIRADLAIALAKHDMAAGQPVRAIPYVQDALVGAAERQDLARVLVAALLQTGQTAAATQISREFDLEEKS
jgi:hypothetical protein